MSSLIGGALGGIGQAIGGLGGVFSQTTQAVKQTAFSVKDLEKALKLLVEVRYRGKNQSLFKSTWEYPQYMKTRHITVDGLFKEDFVSPPFTHSTSSLSTSTTGTM